MDKDKLDQIEDWSVDALKSNSDISQDTIRQIIKTFSETQKKISNQEISNEELEIIAKKVEERLDISMTLGTILSAQDYRPWLDDNRENIGWYYWNRYKRLLNKKKFPPLVVTALNGITDEITDHLENPQKSGEWKRRGLVVGHIQSGKTANYLGVICKASDAGYRVIIVLAGTINSLRNQTQTRIDEGFTGVDSSRQLENIPLYERLVGVGEFDHSRVPITFTTSVQDFNRRVAQQIGAGLGSFSEPVILVIKKNKTIIENLISWIKNNNLKLDRFPFFLIDDEADSASINTNKTDEDATAINRRIRELLRLFPQNVYLGYTATPFANVFIDPETNDEMLGDDLFPKDFILSLEPPDNYIGASMIFGEEPQLRIVRIIDDYQEIIPLRHKINHRPKELPESLKEAIRVFILSKVMRIKRGHENSHNSMLVNISRFTNIQTHIKHLINDYVNLLRESIINYSSLAQSEALRDSSMQQLHSTWQKEYQNVESDWSTVQSLLKTAVSPIRAIEVNVSKNSEPLDYNERDYPNGRSIIAVGGTNLSRGLTLEGLTVSYFLRNTQMYDTLMQMARWFGYRPDYQDLCRIYMPAEAISWYTHISDAIEELRDEFSTMKQANLTPKDFGLCVRSHPESLIVTARNKMRTGKKIIREVSLFGRQIETTVLSTEIDSIKNNWSALRNLMDLIIKNCAYASNSQQKHLFRKVNVDYVMEFINSYNNHHASYLTERAPVVDYIKKLYDDGAEEWDVLLVEASGSETQIEPISFGNHMVHATYRTVERKGASGITSDKRRFGSSDWERAGLTSEQISKAKSIYPNSKTIPGKAYRSQRTIPLLMLYILDCRFKDSEPAIYDNGFVAWGISFPGEAGSRKHNILVEYIVNTVWWKNEFGDSLDDEYEE